MLSCIRTSGAGTLERGETPHSETIEIMGQMDRLRRYRGMAYPFEEAEGNGV